MALQAIEGDAFALTETIRELRHATLCRGIRRQDRRPVLLKLVPGANPSPALIARLRHEHAMLSRVDLAGVAKTLGIVKIASGTALVLDEVVDRALDGDAGLDIRSFLKTAISMAEIVGALHRDQIIHRDIRPHYFFRRPGQELTLVEFSSATRLSQEDQQLTAPSRLEGTLAYMSPEQTGRMNRIIDLRTDLYSLGVSYYELLTGSLPFRSTDPLELVHSHIARLPTAPHLVLPTIPPILSAIVMKLLSKNAEDRYQDAAGIKADLEICLAQLNEGGAITAFPLAQHDFSSELRIPQKLYGREDELAKLAGSISRVRDGGSELLLVTGHSGIGKSALVREVHKQLVLGGRFAAGKFEQLGRSVPYAALSHACRDLVRAVLTEDPEGLVVWKQRLTEALGPNGRVVVDLVPELAHVIGPQPAVQELGPNESQHRFERTFQEFLRAFATEQQPLVIFLDDLQWADAASLRLVQLLLGDRRRGQLLIIGAYRDNEVDPFHPLVSALTELRRAGAPIGEIKLKPLGLGDVAALLVDTLGCPEAEVLPLSELVQRKTDGNPFFINQFLTTLYKEGLLTFNAAKRRWIWDLARVEASLATENVVEFVLAKLRRLPASSRQVLQLAACIGHEFDRETLALISEALPSEVAAELLTPLRDGLVVPVDASQTYLHGVEAADEAAGVAELNPRYRFLHDRIQHAAYALIDEARRREAHLRIGRLLRSRGSVSGEEAIFEIVSHLNLGAALIDDREEKHALARMNLLAARRARDAAAPGAAVKLLTIAIALLGDDPWTTDYELSYSAHLLKAECAYLVSDSDEANRLIEIIERRARSALDRASASNLRTLMLTAMNRMEDAVACGVETARLLGLDFPRQPEELGPAIGAEIGGLMAALAGRSIESLIELPPMTERQSLAILKTLYQIIPAATQFNPPVMVLSVVKAVRLALEHGNAPVSSYFYGCYGLVLVVNGDHETAFRFGQVSIALNERRPHAAFDSANHFLFGTFLNYWRQPLAISLEYLRSGFKIGLQSGDYLHACYCASFGAFYKFCLGESLEELAAELAGQIETIERTGEVVTLRAMKAVKQLVAGLRGELADRKSLDGPELDAREFEETVAASGNRYLLSTYFLARAILRYHAGDFEGAWTDLAKGTPASPGNFVGPELDFYRGILAAARARLCEGESSREEALGVLREQERTFGKLAAASPGTFGHRHAILAAELSALTAGESQTQTLFDRAIASAREGGSPANEALACELCAGFNRRLGRERIARAYFTDARSAYQRWGAVVKVEDLARELPEERNAVGGDLRVEELDALTVVRAGQAISTEIVLPKLIDTLMRIVIEQAGAELGYLMLARDGQLWAEGAVQVGQEQRPFERFRLQASESERLPRSIVGYVQRTREKVLLARADEQNMFSADPYLAAKRPRSLLCLPMLRLGQLVGILYLENALTADAFSENKVGLLEVLASQAAISVENAALYEEMEQRVAARTRDLEASLRLIEQNQVRLIAAERKAAVVDYEREMAIARHIQTSILPKDLHLPGVDAAAAMVTATEVGGDYYDLLPAPDGGFWLGIGDVSGHGLDAGLMMLMVQSGLGALIRRETSADPAAVLCRLNDLLYDNVRVRLRRDDFATLTLLRFFPDGRFVYAGAHEEILIWRAAASGTERLHTNGTWLGIVPSCDGRLRNQEGHLDEGDVMMVYTDGITEARRAASGATAVDGSDIFGVEKLVGVLDRFGAAPPAEICARAFSEVESWTTARADDQTVVVLRRTKSAPVR